MDAAKINAVRKKMKKFDLAVFPADADLIIKMIEAADKALEGVDTIFRIGPSALPRLTLFSFGAQSKDDAQHILDSALTPPKHPIFNFSRFSLRPVEVDGTAYVELGLRAEVVGTNWINLGYEMPGRYFGLRFEDIDWNNDRDQLTLAILPADALVPAITHFTPFLGVWKTCLRAEPAVMKLPFMTLKTPRIEPFTYEGLEAW